MEMKTRIIGSVVIIIATIVGGTYLSNSDFLAMIKANPNASYIVIDNFWYDSNREQIHILTPFESGYSRWRFTQDVWNQLYLNSSKVAEETIDIYYFTTYGEDRWIKLTRKATQATVDYIEDTENETITIVKRTPYYAYNYASGTGGILYEEIILPYSNEADAKITIRFEPVNNRLDNLHKVVWKFKDLNKVNVTTLDNSINFGEIGISWNDAKDMVQEIRDGDYYEIEFKNATGIYEIDPYETIGSYMVEYNKIDITDQCLVDCYLEFNVSANQITDIKDFLVGFEKTAKSLNLLDWGVQQIVDEVREVVIHKDSICVETNRTVKITDNKTGISKNTIVTDVNCTVKETKANQTFTVYKDFNLKEITDKWVNIRIWGKKQPKLGENNIEVNVKMKTTNLKLSWWNSDWKNKKEVNITCGHDIDVVKRIVMDTSTIDVQDDCGDVVFVRRSDSYQLKHDYEEQMCGLTDTTFWGNMSCTIAGETYDTYYNNSAVANQENEVETWASYNPRLISHLDSNPPKDASGYWTDGTVVNQAVNVSHGKYGQGFTFDGTDDSITWIGNVWDDNWTFEFWFNQTAGNQAFSPNKEGAGDTHVLRVNLDNEPAEIVNRITVYTACNGGAGEDINYPTPVMGAWNGWTLIYDDTNSNRTLMVNGTFISSGATPGTPCATINNLTIGISVAYAWADYTGLHDEIRLYDKAHTQIFVEEEWSDAILEWGAEETEEVGDVTPPEITMTAPTNATYYSATGNITLTYYVNEALDTCKYELDGTNYTISGCVNTSFIASEGSHNVKVWGNDTAGNLNVSLTVHFSMDSTIPQLTLVLPANTTYPSTNRSLSFYASEPLDTCKYEYNGTNVTIPNCVNTTFIGEEGSQCIKVWGNDTGGFLNVSNTNCFSIDTSVKESSTTNLYLNYLSQNRSYELGTTAILTANVTNSTGQLMSQAEICLDINQTGYGINHTCASGMVEYNYTTDAWLDTFYDGNTHFDLIFNGDEKTKEANITFHSKDQINSFYINLFGINDTSGYPENITIDALSDGTIDVEARGELIGNNISIKSFLDHTTFKEFNFLSAGSNFTSFNVSKMAKNMDIILNITGINTTDILNVSWTKRIFFNTNPVYGMVDDINYVYIQDLWGQIAKVRKSDGERMGIGGYFGDSDLGISFKTNSLYSVSGIGLAKIDTNTLVYQDNQTFNNDTNDIHRMTVGNESVFVVHVTDKEIYKFDLYTLDLLKQINTTVYDVNDILTDDDYIYVLGTLGEVYVYNSLLSEITHYTPESVIGVSDSILDDDYIYYHSSISDKLIKANKTSGTKIWAVSIGLGCTLCHNLAQDDTTLFLGGGNGYVSKINKETGQVIYNMIVNSSITNLTMGVIYDNDHVYTVHEEGWLSKADKSIGYPLDLKIDFNNDNIYDFIFSGDFKNSTIIEYRQNEVSCTTLLCQYFIKYAINYKGFLNVSLISFNYTLNPVDLNATIINNYLKNQTQITNITLTVTNQANGTIRINNVNASYNGSDSVIVTARFDGNGTHNASNDIQVVSIFYSDYNLTYPSVVKYLVFTPVTNSSKNVTPFGQTSIIPGMNLTRWAYDSPFTLAIRTNETMPACLNYTVNTSSTKGNFILNTTWKPIVNFTSLLQNIGLWWWLDTYDCPSGTLYRPTVHLKACCIGCVPTGDCSWL